MPTAAYYTLGCKVNQTDTAALQHLMEESGYQTVPLKKRLMFMS